MKKYIARFIDNNYKKIQVTFLLIMGVCALKMSYSLGEHFTRKEMQLEKDVVIAEMHTQTDVLLNENGYEWNGTKVVEITN